MHRQSRIAFRMALLAQKQAAQQAQLEALGAQEQQKQRRLERLRDQAGARPGPHGHQAAGPWRMLSLLGGPCPHVA